MRILRRAQRRIVVSNHACSYLERLLKKPTPEIAAVRGYAFLAVKLDIELALTQRLDLRRGQIDRTGEHAACGLADGQIGDSGAARALGDALMQAGEGRRCGQAFERPVDGELAAAQRRRRGPFAGHVRAIVGARGRHPAKARREFFSALRGQRERAADQRGCHRNGDDALSQFHGDSSWVLPRESLSLRPMDAPLGTEFLEMVRHRMLEEYPGQIRACLDALGEDELWWRPHEQANAAGNLVLHLAGSNQFYLGHAIGGGPDTRDRDAEFGARGERSAAEVFCVYERAGATVQRVLDTLTP